MARKKPHEEHENHERYLVTYSDLITLLLAFFIILYAMSTVDKDKVKEFGQSISLAFNHGSPDVIDFEGTKNKNARTEATEEELKEIKEAEQNGKLQELKNEVDKKIKDEKLENNITTVMDKEGLRIILKNEILFNSGEAKIKPNLYSVLKEISLIIGKVPNPIIVSGHTDNLPISTPQYPSNWELSSARAVAVLRAIITYNPAIQPSRISAAGYGEFHPIVENTSENARQQNRRVEILIKRVDSQQLQEVK